MRIEIGCDASARGREPRILICIESEEVVGYDERLVIVRPAEDEHVTIDSAGVCSMRPLLM